MEHLLLLTLLKLKQYQYFPRKAQELCKGRGGQLGSPSASSPYVSVDVSNVNFSLDFRPECDFFPQWRHKQGRYVT